jgi:hypothetical protein
MQECRMYVDNGRSAGSPELMRLILDDLTAV